MNSPSQGTQIGTLIPVAAQADQQVIFIPEGKDAGEITMQITQENLHLVIQLEARAQATVFLEYATQHAKSECSIEVFLSDEASLNCIFLAPASAQNIRIQQKSRIGNGAHLNWQNITLGKGVVEHAVESLLNGNNATSDIDWSFYARDKEQYKLTAANIFSAQNGGGEITMQGVAEHTAHILCNGLINIGEGGKGTDTYLTESVLMLDPTAKVDAIPGLEIKTNDVKASHSATVSRVTTEDLYYFAARGIPEKEAREMFIVGFLSGGLDAVTNETIKERVLLSLASKYGEKSA